MTSPQPHNPLHGVTLEAIVKDLVARRGFAELGALVKIRCFTQDPSVASSLKFLRKTPWARQQIEALYLRDQEILVRHRKRNDRRAAQRAFRAAADAQEGESGAAPINPPAPGDGGPGLDPT